VIDPGVQFKAVERDTLSTDRDFSEVGTDFCVEAVAVHAEVAWGIPETEKSRNDACWLSGCAVHVQLASTTQVHGRNGLAFVAEFTADGESGLQVAGFLFRRQRAGYRSAGGGTWPAGQFLVAPLGIGMA